MLTTCTKDFMRHTNVVNAAHNYASYSELSVACNKRLKWEKYQFGPQIYISTVDWHNADWWYKAFIIVIMRWATAHDNYQIKDILVHWFT